MVLMKKWDLQHNLIIFETKKSTDFLFVILLLNIKTIDINEITNITIKIIITFIFFIIYIVP